MEKKIFIVGSRKDIVFDLSEVIPEMMIEENMNEQQAIDYFMNGLDGVRYGIFTDDCNSDKLEWIVEGKGNYPYVN